MAANTKKNELKNRWTEVSNEYLRLFCEKHEYDYEPDAWIGQDAGTVASIGDMFVSMDDMRYDIDNNVEAQLFDKWYWESLDRHEKGLKYMNYPSFVKGAPDPYTPEQLKLIDELIDLAKQAKKKAVDKITELGGNPENCLHLM